MGSDSGDDGVGPSSPGTPPAIEGLFNLLVAQIPRDYSVAMKGFSETPAGPSGSAPSTASMKSNIKDVARRAEVSIATVSRVLNDTCPVHPDKRMRVEKAIQELGYIPNPAARSLLKRETGALAILLPVITGEFFSEFLTGIDTVSREEKYFAIVSASHREEEQLRLAIRNVCRRVDGMLVMAPESSTAGLRNVIPSGLPVIYVNTTADDQLDDVISFDNFGGARKLVSHLLELGHRRIAIINGTPKASDAIDRFRGYRQALEGHGVKPVESLEIPGDFTQEAGYEGARALLRLSDRPTAVFCVNDNMAVGALRAFQERGVRVPEDIALGGFDDIPMANYLTPSLTTVRVPIKKIGHMSVERLIQKTRAKEALQPEQQVLPVELVIRGSTVAGR